MPQSTDLSIAPYFDDFNEDKRFHEILFKPTVAVQNRELIGLQRILQNQIERLGNNLFKSGTIIEGVNFNFYDVYPYVKIKDIQLDGTVAVPSNYVGYFVKNQNGLTGYVINSYDGFEATDPDLKTIYVKYINSGNSYTDTAFSAGQVLTVYDGNNSIHNILVNSTGSGYSNNDSIVFTPVILANVVSGSFSVGDVITDVITGANGIITTIANETTRAPLVNQPGTLSVSSSSPNVIGTSTTFTSTFSNGAYVAYYSNTTSYDLKKINVVANDVFMNLVSNAAFTNTTATYANTTNSRLYITYSPVASVLSNANATANQWSFLVSGTFTGPVNTNIATVVSIVGENAAGSLITDAAGRIISTTVTNGGDGYTQIPYVSVKSVNGASANLAATNYLGQVTVSSLVSSVGNGYAFGISEGIIYQKGFFIDVEPQTIIIDKYDTTPDGVTVGFTTKEEIINSNIDTSLLDNSAGFPNNTAPGADRLRLTANLAVSTISAASANVDFFNLVEWSQGYPYKQNSRTFYNIINDEAANKISDSSGDYVVDRFLTTTTSMSNASLEANSFNVVIDPGTAYVDGYKVQTYFNFVTPVAKAYTTLVANNAKISLNYQNYVRVNNLGGYFKFDYANVIDLYDTPKQFLSNTSFISSGNTAPTGNKIGTARLRNFVLEQGTPGTANATYRMYLFNIAMNSGANFRNVQCLYANSMTNKGIADVIQEYDATLAANTTILYAKNNQLVFYSGFGSILNANNIDYVYRTTDDGQNIANTGLIQISLSGSPGKVFPYTGTLSDAQKLDLYVSPVANLYSQANLTGTVNVTSTSNVVLGNSTDFVGQLKTGQYISINGGASNNIIRRVTSIVNSSYITVDSNTAFTGTTIGAKLAWPAFTPIPLAYNGLMSANVDGTGQILTINIGATLNVASNTAVVAAWNVESQNPTPSTKTPNRGSLVKLALSNNAATTVGPWCLGVPDIFRLENVYRGNSSVSTASTDVTSEFYIDNNQKAGFYDLGYLNKRQNSTLTLTSDDYLLVKFSCFTTTPGLFTISSYVSSNVSSRFIEDSKPLANLSSTVNTLEIPEFTDAKGNYYDLINSVDFRPYVDAQANVTANTSLVTLNPANTQSFTATNRYFPVPDSIYRHNVEYFLPRIDTVILDKNRNIKVLNGIPASTSPVNIPVGSMRLNDIFVPAYPALPTRLSSNMIGILSTGMASSGRFMGARLSSKEIHTLFTSTDFDQNQPLGYTMEDIGGIERRLKNVENYVAFNLLQQNIAGKTIASSISPTINRFKFGFYVDDYADTRYSDTSSPEYNASVSDGFALPRMVSFNVVHTGNLTSQGYASVKLINQSSATVPSVVTPPIIVTDYQGTMTIVPPQFKTQSFTITAPTASSSATPPATTKSGGKIVCTAMNETYGFGSFRNAIWIEHSRNLPKEYELGYHKLFLPLVEFVYRSDKKDTAIAKLIKVVGERVVRKRTSDLWKMKRGKIDIEGRIYRIILEPICYVFGKFEINKTKKRNK